MAGHEGGLEHHLPQQASCARLGSVSKLGQTDIRRLLIVGAPLGSMLRMRLPGGA